jgi:hypothetical protein
MNIFKHTDKFRLYEVNQDLINFLHGDDIYVNRSRNLIDLEVYTHYNSTNKNRNSDKYIGIIVEADGQNYFAPLSHSPKFKTMDDTCDFQAIYRRNNYYMGSILLCKALPLTHNLVKYVIIENLMKTGKTDYAYLCVKELDYLNRSDIHSKVQDKMIACINGVDSKYKDYRVNYRLAIRNVAEYNAMKLEESNKRLESTEQIIENDYKTIVEISKAKTPEEVKKISKPIVEEIKDIPELKHLFNDNKNNKQTEEKSKRKIKT